jgi:hypothetical protein
VEIGGAEGDRTPDLYNAIVALSQLSYGPEIVAPVWCPAGEGHAFRSACALFASGYYVKAQEN